jgi:hypothetical protein
MTTLKGGHNYISGMSWRHVQAQHGARQYTHLASMAIADPTVQESDAQEAL